MDTRDQQTWASLEAADAQQRRLGLAQVGRRRLASATDRAVELLGDTDEEVRAAAAWALDRLGEPRTLEALLGALHDPVFAVRSNAGWALVHLGLTGARVQVTARVADLRERSSDRDAREMARLVLQHIDAPTV